ncbi:DUF934 domain-containing protein [Sphingopyxis sp.]|uniref:DUF934 domain-containing protein n=1 Tax=Sphingopyxis sp. TaxID=1908224 RepID=UPI002614DC3E|nr:DUF934 domain-containing protein [Sphingopyxis sp.]MCW0197834.1 DUF934 domain-containing protein [Sphingopyxis sp.]
MADALRFRNDDPIEEPAVSLDAFLEQDGASAVRVEAGDDPSRLIPHLARVKLVEIGIPRFRDGRCFTSARILREAGYEGELRAEGDILVDLVFFMRRCGFDSFAPQAGLNRADVDAALSRYANVYQNAADGSVPIWKLRHG